MCSKKWDRVCRSAWHLVGATGLLGLLLTACGGPPRRAGEPAPPAPSATSPTTPPTPPASTPPGPPPSVPAVLAPDASSDLFPGRCARETLDPRLVAAVEAMNARAIELGERLVCVRGEGPGIHAGGRAVDLRFARHAGYGGAPNRCRPGANTTVCRADEDRERWAAIFEAVRATREVRWLAWEYWARDAGVIAEDGSYPRGRYSAKKRRAIRAAKWRHEIGHFELR
ncbi:hypothetical protein L6V77_24825 [Myxococcota bacterium]|nr:hypothetical protein [Myxococcota bacterium]